MSFFFFLMIRRPPRSTLFPTRRSSDLVILRTEGLEQSSSLIMEHVKKVKPAIVVVDSFKALDDLAESHQELDRKSTRLNSSHSQISYAVFCLKKKNR